MLNMTSFVEKAKKSNKGDIFTLGGYMKMHNIDSIFDEMIEDVRYIELVTNIHRIDNNLKHLL